MNTSRPNKEFCVIGCGRLGTNLAVFLSKKGYIPRAFASRTRSSAENASAFSRGGSVCDAPADAAKTCNLVFITTPDGLIPSVCDQVAADGGFTRDTVVYHLSGALSSDILEGARQAGASAGSLHPLQAFAPYEQGQSSPFKGVNMSIEGDDTAVALGQEIVDALGANAFTIPTDAKTLYHASAVVASNCLVTLEQFALTLLMDTGLSEAQAYGILEPLIQGTLGNIKARGCVDALTGPVVRGDEEIIARHLADIDRKMPQFSDLYRLLGRHTLDIARQRPDFPKDSDAGLADLFKPAR